MRRKRQPENAGQTAGWLSQMPPGGTHTRKRRRRGAACKDQAESGIFGMKRLALFDGAADGGKADASGL